LLGCVYLEGRSMRNRFWMETEDDDDFDEDEDADYEEENDEDDEEPDEETWQVDAPGPFA